MGLYEAAKNVISSMSWQLYINQDKYPTFPEDEFRENATRYQELSSWYSGEALEETQVQDGKRVDRYPVRINPFRNLVSKHTAALFGEIKDDDRPMAYARVLPRERKDDSARKAARVIEDTLNRLYSENNGRALQLESGMISQIYGGCVFKLNYVPWDAWRTLPVQIEGIMPESFIGIPEPGDKWRFREAWVVTEIDYGTALQYGVRIDEDDRAVMVEHWTKTKHTLTINGETASIRTTAGTHVFSEDNPWGFIPIVYIPHIRALSFWGESVISTLIGLVEELNLRMADYGDAISDDAHPIIAIRNVQGSPRTVRILKNINVVDLGSSSGLTASGNSEPDMYAVNKPLASDAMSKIVDKLYGQIRRDGNLPAVADGEDEGSQRSSLTLATRFWPLTSHIQMERVNWSTGLAILHQMAIRMLQIIAIRPGASEMFQIPTLEDISRFKVKTSWSPILPKDREAVVNEAVQRAGSSLGSPQHLIEILGDVDDIEEEIDLILEWIKRKAEIQAEMAERTAKAQMEARASTQPQGQSRGNAKGQNKPKQDGGSKQ